MTIKWTEEALHHLDRIHARYSLIDRRLAARMFRDIRQAVQRLGRFPASGRKGQIAGTLELVVANWPYLVVYRIAEDEVQILRVLHTATDWCNSTLEVDRIATDGGDDDA